MPLPETITRRFPALASRDFLIFWVGQFISLIGTWMQSTTLPYLAYRLTGSRLDLGVIGFATTLPTLLLALPGGVIVERLDKRKTVIVLQAVMLLQAATLGVLALTDAIQMWHIVALAFVLGSANAVEITARQAMLVELVGKKALPNAIALQSTIFNTARVLGPALTGVVLVLVANKGEGWAFIINAVSFIFVIIGLTFVRTPFKKESPPTAAPAGMVPEFMEGMNYILANRAVLLLITMAVVLGFFGFPFTQQIPAIARDVLRQAGDTEELIKARTSALYLFQGVGALVAALFMALYSSFKRKGWLLTAGQFAFIFGLAALSFVRDLSTALFIITIVGWGTVSQLAMMNTLIQLQAPDHLRGRVFSTYLWGLQGVAPFGSLAIGWAAQNWGVPSTALACGLVCLAVIGSLHFFNPGVRKTTV